jgi:photosystem II stability/assembly factor-like uncharacterized protein
MRFFISKRAPDGVNVPVERLLAARDHTRGMRRFSIAKGRPISLADVADPTPPAGAAALPGAWTSVGPSNIGGLTRGFVINPKNPDIMYAGAAGGGVWQTTDAGMTWAPLADFLPTIAVNALAIDPSNPNILYAGTGDNSDGLDAIRGLGILKTTDGGQTWTRLPATAQANFYYVFALVVSPNNSNNVYAGTSTGVWRSTDGGNTWTQTLARVAPASGCEELVIRTDQPTDYLFAACGHYNNPPTAVFRTTDAAGGSPWTSVFTVSGMGRTALALAPSQQSTIYALVTDVTAGSAFNGGLHGVYRSDSNGDSGTWQATVTNQSPSRVNVALLSDVSQIFGDICATGKEVVRSQGFHDITIAVDPLNPNRVWAAGIDTFRSDDGGANWGVAMFSDQAAPLAAHADNHRLVFHPKYDGNANQIMYNTSDGGIYMTANADAAVSTGAKAGCSPYPTSVAWQNLNAGYSVTQFYDGAIYPGANQYIAGAQDNGTSTGRDAFGTAWEAVRGGDGGFALVNPQDPNEIYTNYVYLSLDRSTNGGITNTPITAGITEPTATVTSSGGNFLFIVPVVMDPGNPQRLYLGGQALWRTDDRGDTWTQSTTIGPATQGQISAIAVSTADPNTVMYGTSDGEIFYSQQALTSDKTVTWAFSQPRTSGFVARIAFDPVDPQTAYVVYATYTSSGQHYVYKTADGGTTWTPIDGYGDTGLPDAPVHSIVVDPLNRQTLYAGTELGVFTSTDGGNTWMADVNDFANTPITQLLLDRSAGVTQLVAFTYGRGVWKTQIPNTGTLCQYTLSTNALAMDPVGTDTELDIQTTDGCAWSVSPWTSNMFVESPATGTGSGAAFLYSTWNVSTAARAGVMTVADQQVTVTQAPATSVTGNDGKAKAAPIVVTPYLGFEDTRKFTNTATDPIHSCTGSTDYKTAWWSFIAPADGVVTLSAEGKRYGPPYGNSGIVLTMYDTIADPSAELTCTTVARDANGAVWTPATVQIPVASGELYLIEISATGNTASDGGQTILAVTIQAQPATSPVTARTRR